MRTRNHRSPVVGTSHSLKTRERITSRASVARAGYCSWVTMSVMGRPMSPGIRLMMRVVGSVKRRTLSTSSRNKIAISVLSSRFFMSLLARDSSVTLACNSWFTVCSSSFMDCISSLEVVSSSLVDCSSSLEDCNSSLVDLSSSWVVCISSRVDLASSRDCCNSCTMASRRALSVARSSTGPTGLRLRGAATS